MDLVVPGRRDGVREERQRLQFVEFGPLDRVDAPEFLQQLLLAGLAEPGDPIERAGRHALAPTLPVERVGEAVRFVTDALQHEQRLAPPRDLHRM